MGDEEGWHGNTSNHSWHERSKRSNPRYPASGGVASTDIETHLIMSEWARKRCLRNRVYCRKGKDTGLARFIHLEIWQPIYPAGSFLTDGMVVCPCSMKTLAAIASGFSHNLITRCADVSLKEGRKLLLVPRETPLSAIHLENLLKLSRLGVKILPPCVGFYTKPRTVEEIVSHLTGKILDMLEIENHMYRRWGD